MNGIRWSFALLISAAIAISYFDRQILPVAIASIQREIPISNTQFAQLQSAFLLAYAFMYMAGGRLIDVLGTRTGFTAIMTWWSLACASHGIAQGFGLLAVSRALLGMGEGGAFPAATKAISEWFPARERSTAMGIMNAGTAVGAVLAPPLVALVVTSLGWRWMFYIAGAAGLVWTLIWMHSYHTPDGHIAIPPASGDWLKLLSYRQVWGLVIAKFLSDAAWYFYLFWLPKYLYDSRGLDIKAVGYFAWVPYAASGLGSLLGGWSSSRLLHSGRSLNFARKAALGGSAALMPLILLVMNAPLRIAILLFSVAFFGQQSWSTLVMILPADLFPPRAVGSVAGMVGCGGALGGVVFGLLVGYLLDHGFGYGPVFAMVSTFHVLAFCVILLAVPKVERLNLDPISLDAHV